MLGGLGEGKLDPSGKMKEIYANLARSAADPYLQLLFAFLSRYDCGLPYGL